MAILCHVAHVKITKILFLFQKQQSLHFFNRHKMFFLTATKCCETIQTFFMEMSDTRTYILLPKNLKNFFDGEIIQAVM